MALPAAPARVRVWPPEMPVRPVLGAKQGKGYPERRVYKSAQWHDSEHQDVDNMRHQHIELAHPEIVRTGVVRLDLFNVAFHFQASRFEGIRKVVARTNTSVPRWMPTYVPTREPGRREAWIPEGDAGHLMEWWTPLYLDLRQTPSGPWQFEVDTQIIRPDSRIANARIIWKMVVQHEGDPPVPPQLRWMHGEGWVSPTESSGNQFGYMTVTAWGHREYESDPAGPVTIVARAKAGRTVTLMVVTNPNLHAHPADYGTIHHSWTYVAGESPFKTVISQPPMEVGDRMMLRIVDASDPDIGSGATLAVVRLAEG